VFTIEMSFQASKNFFAEVSPNVANMFGVQSGVGSGARLVGRKLLSGSSSSPTPTPTPTPTPPLLERIGSNSNNNNRSKSRKHRTVFETEPVGINLVNSIKSIPTGALSEPSNNSTNDENAGIELYNSLYQHVWDVTSKNILDSSRRDERTFLLDDAGTALESIISINTVTPYYRTKFNEAIDELINSTEYKNAKKLKNHIDMTNIIMDYVLGITGPMREVFSGYELLRSKNKEIDETKKKQLLMIATVQDIWLTHRKIVKENARGRMRIAERKRRRTNRRNTRRRR